MILHLLFFTQSAVPRCRTFWLSLWVIKVQNILEEKLYLLDGAGYLHPGDLQKSNDKGEQEKDRVYRQLFPMLAADKLGGIAKRYYDKYQKQENYHASTALFFLNKPRKSDVSRAMPGNRSWKMVL